MLTKVLQNNMVSVSYSQVSMLAKSIVGMLSVSLTVQLTVVLFQQQHVDLLVFALHNICRL